MPIIYPTLLLFFIKGILKMSMVEYGVVKWFDAKKGYGFIGSDSGKDVFVHYKAIKSPGFRTLTEGQRVEFITETSPKGLQATEVMPA